MSILNTNKKRTGINDLGVSILGVRKNRAGDLDRLMSMWRNEVVKIFGINDLSERAMMRIRVDGLNGGER